MFNKIAKLGFLAVPRAVAVWPANDNRRFGLSAHGVEPAE
jgi:hypothetical protein